MPDVPIYARIREIAAMFSLSESTVTRLIREKKIQSVKVGGSRRILTSSALEYFKADQSKAA